MRRLLVNDTLATLGERTFWHDLQEWFGMTFVGGGYVDLASIAAADAKDATLIIRNASWFPPIATHCPQIALLQDIMEGPGRGMQLSVINSCKQVVYNSEFTRAQYGLSPGVVIPLPIDFDLFKPGNTMGLQQEMGLPRGCVCWVGAQSHVKGYDTFMHLVRLNPDIPFAGVFKDAAPPSMPPNLKVYEKLPQEVLRKVMGACSVGLCTSRVETQHLAGIEMGACGLPMVAPTVGVYWERKDVPGMVVEKVEDLGVALRGVLGQAWEREKVRGYWRVEFDKPVIRKQWERLVEEVECSGAS